MADNVLELDYDDAVQPKTVKLHGKTFSARPLNSAEFFRVLEKSKRLQALSEGQENAQKAQKLQDEMLELIIPTITPGKEFTDLLKDWKRKAGFSYYAAMGKLLQFLIPKQE